MKTEEMRMDNAKLQQAIMQFNQSQGELITLGDFKRALQSLKCLDQYAMDNLAKFLDTNNEGFISIGNFIAKANNAAMGGSSRQRSGMTNPKWSK